MRIVLVQGAVKKTGTRYCKHSLSSTNETYVSTWKLIEAEKQTKMCA